jgi:hypothetical protein
MFAMIRSTEAHNVFLATQFSHRYACGPDELFVGLCQTPYREFPFSAFPPKIPPGSGGPEAFPFNPGLECVSFSSTG